MKRKKNKCLDRFFNASFSQDGFVELNEFGKIFQLLKNYDELSKLFEELDTNNDHRISFKEFKKGHELLGEDSSDEDHLREEFDAIDSNHGGQILFDEVRFYKKKTIRFSFCLFLVLHVYGKEKCALVQI